MLVVLELAVAGSQRSLAVLVAQLEEPVAAVAARVEWEEVHSLVQGEVLVAEDREIVEPVLEELAVFGVHMPLEVDNLVEQAQEEPVLMERQESLAVVMAVAVVAALLLVLLELGGLVVPLVVVEAGEAQQEASQMEVAVLVDGEK